MLKPPFSLKRLFEQTVAVLLITLLSVMVPGMAFSGAEGSETADLSVVSEPPGASVFFDGEAKGITPLELDRLTPGEHRLTLVKDGYIENSRIISLDRGRQQTLDVALTPSGGQTRYATQIGGGGGGGLSLPVILGIAGGGAVAAYFLLRSTNEPPVAGSISVSPGGIGIAALTSFTFTSNASDPDGDSLSFMWDFGDGTTGSGQNTTHVFNSAGNFAVTLTVSDGSDSATASATANVRDVNGRWFDPGLFGGATLELTQNGTAVDGTYRDADGPGTVVGQLTGNRNLQMIIDQRPFPVQNVTGTINDDVTVISGGGFFFTNFEFRRQ